jgi:hypothetical protein
VTTRLIPGRHVAGVEMVSLATVLIRTSYCEVSEECGCPTSVKADRSSKAENRLVSIGQTSFSAPCVMEALACVFQ